jgi:hypothetical protein
MPLIQTHQYKSDPRTLRSTSLIAVVHRNFEETALRVSAYGLSEGRRRSLGMVGQMSAELIGAASELFRMERWYPGSALVVRLSRSSTSSIFSRTIPRRLIVGFLFRLPRRRTISCPSRCVSAQGESLMPTSIPHIANLAVIREKMVSLFCPIG